MLESQVVNTYFQSQSGFWRWSEGGEVVTAAGLNGETIAFRHEVLAIIARLVTDGLPRFQSIVAMLACFKSKEMLVGLVRAELSAMDFGRLQARVRYDESHGEADALASPFLRLQRVSKTLFNRLEFKVELASLLFESKTPAISTADSSTILNSLNSGLGEAVNDFDNTGCYSWGFLQAERFYRRMFRVDFQQLASQIESGLSIQPRPAEIEIPEKVMAREFLRSNRGEQGLADVVAMAEQLMAAVLLPKRLRDLSEAELGGFSDLANRGPLDRLLVSELANDDLTLAIRIAMNEAMYLRRELPHDNQRNQRFMLLHNGIRSWGVPRVFATSVALAIHASNDSEMDFTCYQSDGSNCEQVDLLSKTGLLKHLNTFSTALHPGEALPQFSEQMKEHEVSGEPLLIMSRDEFDDLEFQQLLAKSELERCLVATVTREGDFHLFHWDQNGPETIRRARLDLAAILPGSGASLIQSDHKRVNLPAIFSVRKFPLRLFHSVRNENVCHTAAGLLAVANDRRLMLWEAPDPGAADGQSIRRGGIQLVEELPKGKYTLLHDAFTEKTLVVCSQFGKLTLVFFEDFGSEPVVTVVNDVSGVESLLFYRGVFVLFADAHCWTIDVHTGKSSARTPIGGQLNSSRFVFNTISQRWSAVSPAGGSIRIEELDLPKEARPSEIIGFVESPGRDGPVGIRSDGVLIDSAVHSTKRVLDLLDRVWRVQVSSDRQRAILFNSSDNILVDITKPLEECYSACNGCDYVLKLESMSWNHTIGQFRNRLKGVEVNESGELILVSKNRTRLAVALTGEQIVLTEVSKREKTAQAVWAADLVHLRNIGGFSLNLAEWSSASDPNKTAEVFLDSRGLIHLRSSDHLIPEISFTFKDGQISGWLSTGEVFGSPFYYHADSSVISAGNVYRKCLVPFVELIRDRM